MNTTIFYLILSLQLLNLKSSFVFFSTEPPEDRLLQVHRLLAHVLHADVGHHHGHPHLRSPLLLHGQQPAVLALLQPQAQADLRGGEAQQDCDGEAAGRGGGPARPRQVGQQRRQAGPPPRRPDLQRHLLDARPQRVPPPGRGLPLAEFDGLRRVF